MIWDIIEQKLESANLGTPGQSLFREFMPGNVRQGVMMRSPLTGIPVDNYLPDFYKTSLQLIVRHHDPELGAKLALDVISALVIEGSETYPANAERGLVELKRFDLQKLPIFFPRLDGNGYEWSLNFNAAFVLRQL